MTDLDIIVPVKNESGNIDKLLKRIKMTLSPLNLSYRTIFVDDHSTDTTAQEIKQAARKYPVTLLTKQGKPGKGYSILEAANKANAKHIAMIDGDLQYPPEALKEMLILANENGVVIANRKHYHDSFPRRFVSSASRFIIGRLISGINVDTQSGLKVFKPDLIKHLKADDVSAWGLDVPLLQIAKDLNLKIDSVDINFAPRKNGQSKVKFIKATTEIIWTALKTRLLNNRFYRISTKDPTPLGDQLIHNGNAYTTHTGLPVEASAAYTVSNRQSLVLYTALAVLAAGLYFLPLTTVMVLVAVITLIYFADVIFSLYLTYKSLTADPALDPKSLPNNNNLPVYTILCPLYKETAVLPQFIQAMKALDWPKNKLEIKLLLEEDDRDTIQAVQQMKLPSYFKILVVPEAEPKTKPKACNYGLFQAKGDYVVIYDAEDIPEPDQLKKAYTAFKELPKEYVCVQSKLNYYNSGQNLLTRLFSVEYSLWFDLMLPGLQTLKTALPLGGTSNHFKTKALKKLHGWDPFNVAEDCDLGIRLFKNGYRTALINSTTYEEANSSLSGWINQRSRWIKGYLQTYLVHTRNFSHFFRETPGHALIFHLVIGLRMVFFILNPLLWVTTLSYFLFYNQVGEIIESVYPGVIFYLAVIALVAGNFLYFYNYMIAAAKKGQWSLIKYVLSIPFYWLLTSLAAVKSFYQLAVKPHYWEKTSHGLHIEENRLSLFNRLENYLRPTTKTPSWQSGQIFYWLAIGLGSFALLGAAYWYYLTAGTTAGMTLLSAASALVIALLAGLFRPNLNQ